jgi:hypothetical protein
MKAFYRMMIFMIAILALTALACSLTGTADPTATPVPPTPTDAPTAAPTFTEMPTPTNTVPPLPTATATTEVQEETEEPVQESPAFFTEEFDDLFGWDYFLVRGDEDDMDLYVDNSRLVFDLQGEDQWVYVIYEEQTYEEVYIEAFAENRGKNSNNVSLICHFSAQDGWYEFNITNGGMYNIFVFSMQDMEYFLLDSGGSTNINIGRDVNVYAAECDGNKLTLYINGVEEKEVVDQKYNLRGGNVGISVSSFDVLPILVEIDYFSISQP